MDNTNTLNPAPDATLTDIAANANSEMARISAQESEDAAMRAARYEKKAIDERLNEAKAEERETIDEGRQRFNQTKAQERGKFEKEKEKVAETLKNVAKTSLDYSAKAADFIAEKMHNASSKIN